MEKKVKPPRKLDVKSISEIAIREKFKQRVRQHLHTINGNNTSEKSQQIVSLLSEAATHELNSATPNKCIETWKNDDQLNGY